MSEFTCKHCGAPIFRVEGWAHRTPLGQAAVTAPNTITVNHWAEPAEATALPKYVEHEAGPS